MSASYSKYRLCNDSLSLTCILYACVLPFAHFSCFTHIYNNNTFSLYHLPWELNCSISFNVLHFIQSKICELFILLQDAYS